MPDRNANRPGYKPTPVGWIPEEWGTTHLAEIASFMSNGFVGKAKEHYSAEEDAVRYVQGYNVKPNRIDYTGMKRVSRQFHTRERKTSLCSGDILTVQTGDIGVSVCVPPDLDGANCHALIITRLKPTWGVCGFYVQYLNSARGSTGIMEISTGSTMKHVNAGDMRKLVVPLPPLPEQQRIAEILATWDEALTQTRQLRDAARDRKRALMQQLLTGKLRIAGLGEPASTRSRYPSDWRTLRASELFVRYSRRDGGALPVLAVTQGEGVVPRSSLDRRIEATEESVAGYKVVEAGSFVISLRSFEGGLEYSPYDGVVSPAYHVIKPTAIATAEYYRHYFKSCDFVGRLATAVIGIRDGKQVSYDDFCFLQLPCPPLAEQRAIADVLATADAEVRLLGDQLAALDEQKRGLMQKLLTGEVRVTA